VSCRGSRRGRRRWCVGPWYMPSVVVRPCACQPANLRRGKLATRVHTVVECEGNGRCVQGAIIDFSDRRRSIRGAPNFTSGARANCCKEERERAVTSDRNSVNAVHAQNGAADHRGGCNRHTVGWSVLPDPIVGVICDVQRHSGGVEGARLGIFVQRGGERGSVDGP